MNEKLREKLRESLSSVLPVTAVVLLLSVTLVHLELGALSLFLVGAVFLIAGMGLFQLGVEISMTPLGQDIGSRLTHLRSRPLLLLLCFLAGTVITISEPDLQVLAEQVASVPNAVLVWTVALGVGLFMAVAVLRLAFQVRLANLLLVLYPLLFLVSLLAPKDFLAVAFDAGGVTTGPMTVPFIMALGVGLSASRSDRDGASDSFGLVALCSVGPILMVLLLGIFYRPEEAAYELTSLAPVLTGRDVLDQFLLALPRYAGEVALSLLPVIGAFLLFQLLTRRYRRRQLLKRAVGIAYTLLGLILFLTGVNVGFAPVGSLLGQSLAGGPYRWALVPVGLVLGYYLVKAEPAVRVLNEQVEEITGGTIPARMMNRCLSLGVAAAVGLAMVRVLTGLPLYWVLVPGYAAALLLSRRVPPIFVGVAFDSGGVASGPMTSTFLLPLAIGACTAAGGSVVTDAFGVVALVALTPLIAVQLMGLLYSRRARRAAAPGVLSDDLVLEGKEAAL